MSSTTSTPMATVSIPPKALIVPTPHSHLNHSSHDSVISPPASPSRQYKPTTTSSTSSHADQSLTFSEKDVPSSALGREPMSDLALARDLEKQTYPPSSRGRPVYHHQSDDVVPPFLSGRDGDELPVEDKAFRILLHLSGFACLLSFALSLWTLAAILLAALLQPLRFCSIRPDYREQLVRFLGPPLRLQFRCIYAAPFSSIYNTKLLLVVHLFSPFVAMGIAIAAWVSASFWIYAAMIGDPGSKDGHNDGRESVLVVRSYWERWLLRALR
ncbi:uncharacterized protein BKA78DRAFT_349144 [Phyllosticta capitalensis]|uniref:uncharacterized protein n=1 Tax=Phyllosticta capitalensis TaxID=121624 RepID=UPI003130B78F